MRLLIKNNKEDVLGKILKHPLFHLINEFIGNKSMLFEVLLPTLLSIK
jgi:hypothetical protein